jgi:hypothetical protein
MKSDKKMSPFEEKKCCFIKTTAIIHELRYELLPHSLHSPDLAPSDFFLFVDLKRMLAGKKFSTNLRN